MPLHQAPDFRSITDADLPNLLDLWVESWAEAMPHIDFSSRRESFSEILATHRATGYCVIGLFATVLVGFIAVNPATGDLDQICVCTDTKGTRAALDLLNHAKLLSPSLLTLKVNAANPRAIRFYEREGFIKFGEGINPRSGLPIFHYRWRPK
jgi:putative acetyltransferase